MENLSDKYLQTFYESQLEWLRAAVETLEIQNVDALMDEAASEFINMIPFMPYRNDVEHSMAVPLSVALQCWRSIYRLEKERCPRILGEMRYCMPNTQSQRRKC